MSLEKTIAKYANEKKTERIQLPDSESYISINYSVELEVKKIFGIKQKPRKQEASINIQLHDKDGDCLHDAKFNYDLPLNLEQSEERTEIAKKILTFIQESRKPILEYVKESCGVKTYVMMETETYDKIFESVNNATGIKQIQQKNAEIINSTQKLTGTIKRSSTDYPHHCSVKLARQFAKEIIDLSIDSDLYTSHLDKIMSLFTPDLYVICREDYYDLIKAANNVDSDEFISSVGLFHKKFNAVLSNAIESNPAKYISPIITLYESIKRLSIPISDALNLMDSVNMDEFKGLTHNISRYTDLVIKSFFNYKKEQFQSLGEKIDATSGKPIEIDLGDDLIYTVKAREDPSSMYILMISDGTNTAPKYVCEIKDRLDVTQESLLSGSIRQLLEKIVLDSSAEEANDAKEKIAMYRQALIEGEKPIIMGEYEPVNLECNVRTCLGEIRSNGHYKANIINLVINDAKKYLPQLQEPEGIR